MPEAVPPRFPRPLLAPGAAQGSAFQFSEAEPLRLDCGRALAPYTTAYMMYGHLNDARSNVILVCHALTGDQFVTGTHPVTGREGWWPTMVGPGKPIDTDRYFVLCANVIGGCMGSTGPAETDPHTNKSYGFQFPVLTIGDMVRAQAALLDALKIDRLLSVTGGSMGGMQVLEWLARYPERIVSAMPIATSSRHTAQNIAFHEVGRQAILADPNKGLAVARMIGHLTYLSEAALERKFGRALQDRDSISYSFGPDFQVENYLHHQGRSFVERFDAASYIYITRAMDYFDLAAGHGGDLAHAFARARHTRVRQFSFTSDWLFPTAENRRVLQALHAAGVPSELVEIVTDRGHDAFLLDEPDLFASVREFLETVSRDV